jgi:DNA-binding CsgD family transcriptional regulator
MQVLSARGVQSESELPFSALHQLLRPALAEIPSIPIPQAKALAGALGIGEAASQERFLIFVACLSLLSELADRQPVLCLIDDAQWLDGGSAAALLFVTRRLDAEGIAMLFAAREGEPDGFAAPGVPYLRLEGLDGEAADRLLLEGAGVEAAPHVRDQLVAQTGGNPLALLEIPSGLTRGQLSGEQPLPRALPLTRQVEDEFLRRARSLTPDAQRLLLIAAADDSEAAATVARAAGSGDEGLVAINLAEVAGLVFVDGARLKFRHPLVRSAVYSAATSADRRAAHRALAAALEGDPEQADRRAWHLAAAAIEPDETIANALREAAERAQSRAAFVAAASALERAAELSTNGTARARRLVEAARCASVAGADERALALVAQARLLIDDPLQRAELASVVGVAEIRRGNPANVCRPLMNAAREISALEPDRALQLLLDAAWAASEAGDPAMLEVCRLAAGLVGSVFGNRTGFIVSLLSGLGAVAERDTETAITQLGKAIAAGFEDSDPYHVIWAGSAAFSLGDEERAGALYLRGAELARARGSLGLLAPALGYLSLRNLIAQRFDQAVLTAAEAEQLARDAGAENLIALPKFVLSAVAAIRGEDDEARRLVSETVALASAHGLLLAAARPAWALALLDLGRGRWEDALARLESISAARMGLAGAITMRTIPDRIEAAVRAGRPEAARPALAAYESWAARGNMPWVWPRLAGCRALLAEGAEATAQFEEALALGADARPFDLARIHLLYGEHLRRERRRSDSRVHFRAALEGFEQLGAEPWAERARSELRASGETARRRNPSTIAELTPQELQIARLVAEGLSNKEVAAQLFLSPRTIDAHLRSVFSKLDISSRTQLAKIPLDDDAVPAGG